MKFTLAFSTILLATATALTVPISRSALSGRNPSLLGDIEHDAGDAINDLKAFASLNIDGCTVAQCAADLGPAAASCLLAAVQKGANAVTDLTCISLALKDYDTPPTSCSNCAQAIKKNTK